MKVFVNFVIASVLLQQGIFASSQKSCTGSYEVFAECGTACPQTCDNYDSPAACTDQCVPGCYCKKGYVRNKDGVCCLPSECKPQVSQPRCSGTHETYTTCGTACPLTCDNYQNSTMICTRQCVAGCFCDKEYVRNKDGKCCLPTECKPAVSQPRCSRSHELYTECGSACPLTCDNYENPLFCTLQCVAGCYCEEGYIRNQDGNCCRPSDCKRKGSQPRCARVHEIYSTCGSACPLTCDNYLKPPTICTAECVQGCFCRNPYVRESDNSCVLKSQCKPKAIEPQQPNKCNQCKGRNEIYKSCGTLCPNTCATKDIKFKCREGCQPGCYCADGYLRNSQNKCVLICDCD